VPRVAMELEVFDFQKVRLKDQRDGLEVAMGYREILQLLVVVEEISRDMVEQ